MKLEIELEFDRGGGRKDVIEVWWSGGELPRGTKYIS